MLEIQKILRRVILLYVWVLVDIEDKWYCYIFDDTEDWRIVILLYVCVIEDFDEA